MISALGQCPTHHIDMMSVTSMDGNEQRICVKCRAASEPKMGRTQIVDDPGESFNGYVGGKANIQILKEGAPGVADVEAIARAARKSVAASAGLTLEEIVERAVSELGNLPMPKDIKQFKKVQKVIKTLQSLVESQNG